MAKRLVIDMYKCDECTDGCAVQCGYLYQPKVTDHGLGFLREQITFQVICRRCEEANCVASCKFQALEKQQDGVIKRATMRCTSCKCCTQGCPFGTIYPELVPFFAVRCDYCMAKTESGDLACVQSCVKKAIEFREVDPAVEKDIVIVSDHLAVKAPKWDKAAV